MISSTPHDPSPHPPSIWTESTDRSSSACIRFVVRLSASVTSLVFVWRASSVLHRTLNQLGPRREVPCGAGRSTGRIQIQCDHSPSCRPWLVRLL